MTTPNRLRGDLPPLPPRIARLRIDERGYPVPWFVPWIDGKPEFRMADSQKWAEAIKFEKCWVCGEGLGHWKAFILGPMCCITGTTSEPPLHVECAQWTVRGCPFLSKPQMVRREDELTEANKKNVAGEMIERNPGAAAIWVTHKFSLFKDPHGKPLISVGDPMQVSWWRLGRPATREEVQASIDTGLPLLQKACRGLKTELEALAQQTKFAEKYLPL